MEPTSVVLTGAYRDAIFEEIEFVFESARNLPFMLAHGAASVSDRDEARDLIWRLQVAARLLDQLGWQQSGNRDRYVLELDEDLDRFAARIESYALLALEDNRRGLLDGNDEVRATARRLIDTDLDAFAAARVVRGAFTIGRGLEPPAAQPPEAT